MSSDLEFEVNLLPSSQETLSDAIIYIHFLSTDDGNIGDHYRVVSRIISSSVQPPPGKLAEPVVIEFSGIKELLESMVID